MILVCGNIATRSFIFLANPNPIHYFNFRNDGSMPGFP